MVLRTIRLKARPHERWPKKLKAELENNSRKPRELVRKLHSDSLKNFQLTLSRGNMKKGDEVADDRNDDTVRTSVSQDQVTVTLSTEELLISTQYI
jgi:hypothetical protein